MKKIGIVVSASVAIIKIKELKLKLLSKGYIVFIIPTDNALKYYKNIKELEPIILNSYLLGNVDHINFMKELDLIIVAPASINTISKFINGICDNIASTLLIAYDKKIIFAPAMNTRMYNALILRNYIETLEKWGHYIIGPEIGWLKEGEYGIGRMSKIEDIFNLIINILETPKQIKTIIVSYGASKIYIDPIRYISNDSSGLFGKLIIKNLKMLGYDVKSIDVGKYTNEEILNIVKNFDIYISCGAISDFYSIKSKDKIKKNSINKIDLFQNIDVISELRKINKNQKILGFKLDENIDNAIKKMNNLNLDGILYNQINSMNNSNISGCLFINNQKMKFENKNKSEIAKIIAKEVEKWIYM